MAHLNPSDVCFKDTLQMLRLTTQLKDVATIAAANDWRLEKRLQQIKNECESLQTQLKTTINELKNGPPPLDNVKDDEERENIQEKWVTKRYAFLSPPPFSLSIFLTFASIRDVKAKSGGYDEDPNCTGRDRHKTGNDGLGCAAR